jgi:hypothetical protein
LIDHAIIWIPSLVLAAVVMGWGIVVALTGG